MKVQLNFILAVQLLDVCRKIERYLRLNGRFPRLGLDFR